MAYASRDELAEALRIRVTAQNTQLLTDCLDAAADQLDSYLDRTDPLPDPIPAAVVRANVNRAVRWFKSSDIAGGAGGSEQVGIITAPADPLDSDFGSIVHHKQGWGIG